MLLCFLMKFLVHDIVLVAFAGTCILEVFFSVSLMVNGMVLEDETIFFAKNRVARSGEHPFQHIQR